MSGDPFYPTSGALTIRSAFQIRFLNAKDGLPHHLSPNVILWNPQLYGATPGASCAKMTASRFMLFVSMSTIKFLIVWDWRTGDVVRVTDFWLISALIPPPLQVLERYDVHNISVHHQYSAFSFLDEFRLLASTEEHTSKEGELCLVIFDTSLPQSPDICQRLTLNIAPTHHNRYALYPWAWEVRIHTDSERSQGGGSRDGPFIPDPTQSVVVIVLHHRERVGIPGGEVILVVRATTLIGYLSSTPSDQPVPWDEWKKDVMVVVPIHHYVQTFVLGTRVLLMSCDQRGGDHVKAYDFSRWGCRALVRVGEGEKERMVLPNPKKTWSPKEPSSGLEKMQTLGDSLVMCRVRDS